VHWNNINGWPSNNNGDSNSQSQGAAIGGNEIDGNNNSINQQIIQQEGSGSGSGDGLSHCKAFCVN
jgi:hypothetical protein